MEGMVQGLNCLGGRHGNEVAISLKTKHKSLKPLQEGIVQFAGDPFPFAESRLELQVQTSRHLAQPPLITRPSQKSGTAKGEHPKPDRLTKRLFVLYDAARR